MEISAALAAELAVLTEALDDPDADVADSVLRLAADARAAVASYLGLMVIVAGTDTPITVTAFEDDVEPGDIRASLLLPAPSGERDGGVPGVSLILFAGVAGAFVDLAADLCWLTGRPLVDISLDQHLGVLADGHAGATLHATSVINQALGVLMGRGYTRDQADRELDARAADAGTDRRRAAAGVLRTIPAARVDLDGDGA